MSDCIYSMMRSHYFSSRTTKYTGNVHKNGRKEKHQVWVRIKFILYRRIIAISRIDDSQQGLYMINKSFLYLLVMIGIRSRYF